MEETKPKRATRSLRGSVDGPTEQAKATPKKSTRSKKMNDISEKENTSQRNIVEDFDDSASSKSSGSVRSCKVVLRRENFDDIPADDGRAIAHSTRGRRNSQLTEENIANMNSPGRSLRSASVASDGTESTITRTTRSRLASSQNTPKKDASSVRPATPSRRSSRLLSENEKAADSPKKTPAKRTLRSNSVISVDDISPPTSRTRTSSRLTESQNATPKSLKTKVSKIIGEPTTPRRASTRVNKSVIMADVIDEEASENEDSDKTVTNKVDKSKNVVDIPDDIEEEIATLNENTPKTDAKVTKTPDVDETEVVSSTMEVEKSVASQPIVDEEYATPSTQAVASSSDSVKSPTVLMSTSTVESPKADSPVQQKADTPAVEPTEPMEISMTEQAEITGTPKSNALKNMEKSKTPKADSPQLKASKKSEGETIEVDIAVASPAPSKSKSQKSTPVGKSDSEQLSSSSLVHAYISNDFEPMETEITSPKVNRDDSLKTILKNYTPKSKARASNAFNSMDVTALTHEVDEDEPTSKTLPKTSPKKRTSKRISLNESTGFDRIEVSILALDATNLNRDFVSIQTDSTKVEEADQLKSPLPKAKTPSKVSIEATESPLSNHAVKSSPKIKTPKANTSKTDVTMAEAPKVETPKSKTPEVNSSKAMTPKAVTPKAVSPKAVTPKAVTPKAVTPKAETPKIEHREDETSKPMIITPTVESPKPKTPKSKSPKLWPSPKKTPLNLNSEIDKIIAGLATPVVNNEVDSRFEAISDTLTPANKTIIDENFDRIASDKTPKAVDQSVSNKSTHDVTTEPDELVNNSVVNETKDDTTINETQSEVETSLQTENVPQEKSTSKTKPERKSVQIMTPKVVKSQSSLGKRVDTPYPPASALKAAASQLESDEGKSKPEENREHLDKLKGSWNKSIKLNSLNTESPKPIDKFGTENTDDGEPKKSVATRNNWTSNDLIDSDSELDSTVEESAEEPSDEECDEENENSLLDDEAEEVDDYESGDSMDDEDRAEIEENEIEVKGVDLGSDDTSDEEVEEDDYDSEDGFIVDDTEEVHNLISDEEEEIVVRNPRTARRPAGSRIRPAGSRIIRPSSSDESDTEDSNGGARNEIVSVSIQAEEIVVVAANPPQTEEIVEGKKFATTFITPKDEDTHATNNSASKQKVEESKESHGAVKAKPIESQAHPEQQEQEKIDEGSVESTSTAQNEPEVVKKSATKNINKVDKNSSQALLADLSGKENEKIVNEKRRTSLPGIDRLSKVLKDKKTSRMSLGDLNPNSQVLRVGLVKTQLDKTNSTVKKATPNKSSEANKKAQDSILVDGGDMNASTSSTENMSPNKTKNAPLEFSSQEENNNQKKSDKKRKKSEIISTNSDLVAEASSSAEVVATPTTGMIDNKNKNKNKSKRKFNEIDTVEDQCERPKAKKLLKIINTASGKFIEEPMTPEKQNRHGFNVTPLTPVNPSFRVEKRINLFARAKTNKRKSIYLDEEEAEAAGLLLPKPRWQINTQFEDEQPRKRARKLEVGQTEVILQPVEPKKKGKAVIAAELRQFRHNHMYRSGIPRQDARALLRQKYKRNANYK